MIQEGDILSGRKLNLSFPNTLTFTEGSTIVGSENYSIQAEYVENEYCTIGLYNSSDVLIDAFYTYDIPDASIVLNIPTYTLPADFGIVSTVDAESGLLQYISAVFGQEVASDTINMATYLSTHNDAAKTATNYLSWISQQEGLVISENPVTDISAITGGNTRINSEGMRVFDGTTQVARFGTTSTIGDETKKNIRITPTEVTIGESAEQYFTVNMEGRASGADPHYYYSTITFTDKTGVTQSSIATLTGAPTWQTGSRITLWQTITESGSNIPNTLVDTLRADFTFGTASTVSVVSDVLGVTYTYIYDGYDQVETSGKIISNTSKRSSKYLGFVAIKTPSLEFGQQNNEGFIPGADSACLGVGLVALGSAQTVLGKWNEYDDTNDYTMNQYGLIIGNGGSDTTRGNALTVDWAGNLVCNDISTLGDVNVTGDVTATGEVHGSNILKIARGQFTNVVAPIGTWEVTGLGYGGVSFTSAPIVVATFYSTSSDRDFGNCTISVHSVTTSSFAIKVFNNSTDERKPYINWIAIGI